MEPTPRTRSGLERGLSVVTEVEAGEGPTALLLTLNVFLLLTAYYVIKPVREALILVLPDGDQYKSYMSGAIAVALLLAVPAYARATNRWPRGKLVVGVTLFFASHLVLFWLGSAVEAWRANIALLFFLWVGVFNMMVVAQFWGFANDIYAEEQGKRLFALIGLGASVGAAVGSRFAASLIDLVGLYPLLLVAAAMLAGCAMITKIVDRREPEDRASAPPPKARPSGAFGLVLGHPYLRLLAAFSLIFTFVNTNGEYLLSRLVKGAADALVAAGELAAADAGAFIGTFYGDFFFWVNVLGVLIQSLGVSRIIKFGGLGAGFMVLPVIALFDAAAMIVLPSLAVLRVGKTLENAADYSINNTVRNMLWLPTTREMKFKAKQAVDTFFVRMGDVGSAGLVFVGSSFAWSVSAFAASNLLLVALWLVLAVLIVRQYARLSAGHGLTASRELGAEG